MLKKVKPPKKERIVKLPVGRANVVLDIEAAREAYKKRFKAMALSAELEDRNALSDCFERALESEMHDLYALADFYERALKRLAN